LRDEQQGDLPSDHGAGCDFYALRVPRRLRRVGGHWRCRLERGFMSDVLHPSQLGHDDIAHRVEDLLGLRPR